MKKLKRFWGIFPIALYFFLTVILSILEISLNVVLRNTPGCIMFWFLIVSSLVFIIYAIIKFLSWSKIKKYKYSKIIRNIIFVIYGIGVLVALYIGIFVSAFAYPEEKIVEQNGMTMVQQDYSFLGVRMKYYEYKSPLFRGNKLLKEISNKTYWIYNLNGELIETGTYDN